MASCLLPFTTMIFGRLLASLVVFSPLAAGSPSPNPDKYRTAFEAFVAKYGKVYQNSEEENRRFNVFKSNCKFIESENAHNHSYTMGVNEFSDQSWSEFRSGRLGLMQRPLGGEMWKGLPFLGSFMYSGAELPTAIDWSAQGAVTPSKNQGSCGSCWSFSTTGALEGAWQIATGKLVSLSEQQLVDCSTENHACKGGEMDLAFKFFKENAACTEDSYSYQGQAGQCKAASCTIGIPSGSVTGYYDVPGDDTNALMEAVSKQPVSVGIEADERAFQSYTGGVLQQTCGAKLDHGVLVVGYGTDNGVDYWKVKNSWGPAWGEEGYIRFQRGLPNSGECGIKAGASYPVVQSSSNVTIVV